MAGEVHYYTVEEASRVLRLTPERVVEMLEAGELEGIPSVGGAGWMIPIHGGAVIVPPPVSEVPAEPPTNHGEARELPKEHGEPILPPQQAIGDVGTPPQPAEHPRGDDAANDREPTSESGWVTTQQAARALGISARTVRWHIERGNIEAKPEGEGVERTWRVSVDSLQAFRDARQRQPQQPRDYRASVNFPDIAAVEPGNAIRELADRLVDEARRAEAARVRLELAERAQSSLEAELTAERQRREDAERQRREAEMERDAARRELEALGRTHQEPPQTPPSSGPGYTLPGEGPQTGVEPLSETRADTAAAATGPLRPPDLVQESPQEIQKPLPRGRRRGLLRRFFRG